MRKIITNITIIAISLLLFSCGNDQNKKVIGTPIKMGSFEVAENDLSKLFNWNEGKGECVALGDGWRLPTKEEMEIMHNYPSQEHLAKKIFDDGEYWSSNEIDDVYAWSMYLNGGKSIGNEKTHEKLIRPVRSL